MDNGKLIVGCAINGVNFEIRTGHGQPRIQRYSLVCNRLHHDPETKITNVENIYSGEMPETNNREGAMEVLRMLEVHSIAAGVDVPESLMTMAEQQISEEF